MTGYDGHGRGGRQVEHLQHHGVAAPANKYFIYQIFQSNKFGMFNSPFFGVLLVLGDASRHNHIVRVVLEMDGNDPMVVELKFTKIWWFWSPQAPQ